MTPRTQDALACGLLSGLWWLPALAIGIAGEFPISDDWAYAHTVQVLLETGRFERPAWTWAPSLTNVGLGAVFSWLGGFSYAALRLSSLFAGWLGVLACFALARGAGIAVAGAALAAACLALNPMYVNLAFTFMTDVTFVALTTGSLVALAAALRGGSIGSWVAAAGLALAAVLSRQPAIMLPIAAGAALLIAHRKRPLVWLVTGGLALLGVGVYTALPYLYGSGDGGRHMRIGWFLQHTVFAPEAPYHVACGLLTCAAVLGLSLLPLALATRLRRKTWLAGGIIASALLALAWRLGLDAPLHIDIFRADLGLGAMTLPAPPAAPSWSGPLWWFLDALGILVTGSLTVHLAGRWRRFTDRPDLWALGAFPAFCLAVLLFQQPFFDRWLLAFVPPLAVVVLHTGEQGLRPMRGFVAVAWLGLWGWLGTADAMDHHRARWALLEELREAGVASDRIDGGFEFNGLFNFAKNDRDWSRFKEKPGSRWVVDDEYVISQAVTLPGYEPIAERSYTRRLPPGEAAVRSYRRRLTR